MGADEADLLADEEFGVGGEEGGLAEAAEHEVEHGGQVSGVGFAMAEVSLLAGELDLVGVEEAVLEGGEGLSLDVCGIVVHQGACPGFVVDACWFVAEEDEGGGMFGDEVIGHVDELGEAGLGGGEAVRAYQFLAGGGASGGPVDVLADVQEDDEDAGWVQLGQALAEGGDAVGVVAFQVAQTFFWWYTLS